MQSRPVMSALDSSSAEYRGPMASPMSELAIRPVHVGGAESVRDFVEDHEVERAFAGDHLGLIGGQEALGERQNDDVHACVQEILPEDFLRAFFLMDARIVRQIIGDGLIAVEQIARAIDAVHHFHRRLLPALRRQILWPSGSDSCRSGTYF